MPRRTREGIRDSRALAQSLPRRHRGKRAAPSAELRRAWRPSRAPGAADPTMTAPPTGRTSPEATVQVRDVLLASGAGWGRPLQGRPLQGRPQDDGLQNATEGGQEAGGKRQAVLFRRPSQEGPRSRGRGTHRHISRWHSRASSAPKLRDFGRFRATLCAIRGGSGPFRPNPGQIWPDVARDVRPVPARHARA